MGLIVFAALCDFSQMTEYVVSLLFLVSCEMNNYIVMSYRDVNVITKTATRRTSKA